MSPNEASLAWVRGRADKIYDLVTMTGGRLGTWLLLGNVAALVLLLQTATGASVSCDPAPLMASGQRFALGMAFAFAAWVVNYGGSIGSLAMSDTAINRLATVVANEAYIRHLEKEFGEHYKPGELEAGIDAAAQHISILQKRMRWLLVPSALGYVLFGVSAWHFGHGVFASLAPSAIAACAGA